jgi:hydroxypyruvate isomerase
VELQAHYDHPPSAVRAALDRHALTLLGINTAAGREGELGLAAVPGREQDFATLFRQALDYAGAIGAASIHCLAGAVAPELRPAAEKIFIDNISRAADLAAARDIKILIEPINPRDRPNYFLTRPEQAADLIGRIGRPNVRIQFDFYHAQIVGGDLIRRFEQNLPFVGHVQIAAVPSRAEPDEGEVNYPAVLAALDKLGYAGWIGCEYRPRGRTEEGLGWAKPYGITPRAS